MRNSKEASKGKKGITPLIGYVLLVVFAVVISSIVFQWLRTYIPAQAMECPDGVSLFLNNATFTPTEDGGELSITITNNGRFIFDGYFINIKNDSSQDLAIIGISEFLDEDESGLAVGTSGYVLIGSDENPFEPQDQATHFFDIPKAYGKPCSVSIIPTRQQEYKERERFVSCGNARVEEVVGEPGAGGGEEEEEPGTCTDGETQDCPIQEGVCSGSERTCTDGEWPACDYSEIPEYEQTEITCDDELDNDCDGYADSSDNDCEGGEITLLEDGFEVVGENWDANWNDNGETDWSHASDEKHSGIYSAENIGGYFFWGDNDLISDDLDASDADEIQVFFWYYKDDLDPNKFYIQLYDGNGYDTWEDLNDYDGPDNCAGTSGDDKWCRFDETITSSEYFISEFRLKFEGTDTDWGERVWIDDVSIIKSY